MATQRLENEFGGAFLLRSTGAGSFEVTIGDVAAVYEQGVLRDRRPRVLEPGGALHDRLKTLIAADGDEMDNFGTAAVTEMLHELRRIGHGGLIAVFAGETTTPAKAKYRFTDTRAISTPLHDAIHASDRFFRLLADSNDRAEQDAAYSNIDEQRTKLLKAARDAAKWAAVDNALLLDRGLRMVAAGWQIPAADAVVGTVDVRSAAGGAYDLTRHGTRHRAAAAFAWNNPGSLAFTVSRDGPVKIFVSDERVVTVHELDL